ncbi:MAG: AzlD domain-containing protein [Rhizobiales bacterium]|nr:AzlD domain-containing protein [Hyphomicrobiales bacterium]NRB13425.1 AzlD domain-containing protein [Hyphomicrobiales bacterium]
MVEPWVILISLPIVVYFTRVFGILMSNFVAEDSPYRSTLIILPICAMASFFIPRALEGSPSEQAVLVVFLVVFWLTNNSMISMIVGLGGLLALQFLT